MNAPTPQLLACPNNNLDQIKIRPASPQSKVHITSTVTSPTSIDNNKNTVTSPTSLTAGRFTLQTVHLPKPQMPVLETKIAKTIMNNNRKINTTVNQTSGDEGEYHNF